MQRILKIFNNKKVDCRAAGEELKRKSTKQVPRLVKEDLLKVGGITVVRSPEKEQLKEAEHHVSTNMVCVLCKLKLGLTSTCQIW